MPTGLTQDGINLLSNAKSNGVSVHAVNIMAMDYGASYSGDMGQYAIDGATATQAQVKSVLGLSDTAAWNAIAVTPMIGVNDVSSETFTVSDATQLVDFAKTKHLAWLSISSHRAAVPDVRAGAGDDGRGCGPETALRGPDTGAVRGRAAGGRDGRTGDPLAVGPVPVGP
jgi:hypothetical protein